MVSTENRENEWRKSFSEQDFGGFGSEGVKSERDWKKQINSQKGSLS